MTATGHEGDEAAEDRQEVHFDGATLADLEDDRESDDDDFTPMNEDIDEDEESSDEESSDDESSDSSDSSSESSDSSSDLLTSDSDSSLSDSSDSSSDSSSNEPAQPLAHWNDCVEKLCKLLIRTKRQNTKST
jgi:hypothetical protein